MATAQKDTIYVDIDDEITSLIDKVRSSNSKIVALVLPKRATVLQSIVNMKLLKRTSEQVKKRVVLITSETGILPLAGAVGMHVAKTLQSKPAIPPAPAAAEGLINIDAQTLEDAPERLDPTRPIGELAGIPVTDEDEPIEVDSEPTEEDTSKAALAAGTTGAIAGKKGLNKKLRIPNFEKFRLWLILGGSALVLLIVGLIFASVVLPKARIVIKTDTSSLTTDLNIIASPTFKEVDKQALHVPAVNRELKKTEAEKVPATGQKDIGTKATGTVSLKNCSSADGAVTIPANREVVTNNLTFITQEEVTLPASIFTGGSRTCITQAEDVKVTAQNPGDQYNVSAGRTFAVPGYSSVSGSNAEGMAGGTSKVVKVVSQQDVDSAKQKLQEKGANVKNELKDQLNEEKYVGVEETFSAANPAVTSAPNIGEEASEVTVTSIITYTMLGIKEDDLKQLIEEDTKKRIDTTKQQIQEDGMDKLVFRLSERKPNGETQLNVQTIVVAGPQLDSESIKREIAGKKKGEVQRIIQSRPGIKDVDIKYSPFWVYSTPKKTAKITIVFETSNAESR